MVVVVAFILCSHKRVSRAEGCEEASTPSFFTRSAFRGFCTSLQVVELHRNHRLWRARRWARRRRGRRELQRSAGYFCFKQVAFLLVVVHANDASSGNPDDDDDDVGGSFVHVPLRPEFHRNSRSDVLCVGFSQNYSLLLCGTESGFKVYKSDTLDEKLARDTSGRGLAIVETLHKSSVYALVGGGKSPCYPLNTVMMYNAADDRCFGELAFRSVVRAVRLVPDHVVVVLEFKVHVYDFALKLVYQFETLSNIHGVVATTAPSAADPTACVLACLSHQRTGEVRIKKFNKRGSYHIQAHAEPLACLALNSNGSLLATASTRGSLVHIFRTSDGTKLQELRRGGDAATIYSMAFSVNSQWLALSSSKETVHVFSIKPEEQNATTKLMASESGSRRLFKAGSMLLSSAAATAGSSLSFVKGMMPKLLISERSLCQFRLPKQSRAKVGFGLEKNTIIVVCTDGSLYKCSFDPVKGGACRLQQDFYFP